MSEKKPFHNPFEALRGLRETMPDPPEAPASPEPATASAPAPHVARAVVRLERSGRGGKEVTVIDRLNLPQDDLHAWLKALKTALGCGGAIEEDRLVLQGDQRKRAGRVLTERGVKRVTVG